MPARWRDGADPAREDAAGGVATVGQAVRRTRMYKMVMFCGGAQLGGGLRAEVEVKLRSCSSVDWSKVQVQVGRSSRSSRVRPTRSTWSTWNASRRRLEVSENCFVSRCFLGVPAAPRTVRRLPTMACLPSMLSRRLTRKLSSLAAPTRHQGLVSKIEAIGNISMSRASPILPASSHLDFSDSSRAFASTSTFELLRGAAVLTACSQPILVQNSERLLSILSAVLGQPTTEAILKHTVYAHFVAGEDADDIAPKLRALHVRGVGGILDYAAEGDLDQGGPLSQAGSSSNGTTNQPARVYPYAGEESCDANLEIFLRAVDAVEQTTPDGFAAIKVTALGDPSLLERVSIAVTELNNFFHTLDVEGRGTLLRSQFLKGWCEAFESSAEEAGALFDQIHAAGLDAEPKTRVAEGGLQPKADEAAVDVFEFTNALPLDSIGSLVLRCKHRGPLYRSALGPQECEALGRLLDRLDAIAARARSLGVRLMIDAEHTYFQPAIDHCVLRLSRTHNRGVRPIVYGTYQAYLRDCGARLSFDLERAHREGWSFGAKLVRGAYMEHERRRAAACGYPDPIQPTAQATHESYDAAIDQLLLHCPSPQRTAVMVATHNRSSVERAASYLLADSEAAAGDGSGAGGAAFAGAGSCPDGDTSAIHHELPVSRVPVENVSFGQLLGMADQLTFTLASHGLRAYKCARPLCRPLVLPPSPCTAQLRSPKPILSPHRGCCLVCVAGTCLTALCGRSCHT